MIQTLSLSPGVTLRCCPDDRFKKNALSIQLLRPMCREEAAMNALLTLVLLRGTKTCPDLRGITHRLDDLYGGYVAAQARRVGDVQTVGLYMELLDDRFAMEGDSVLAAGADFLRELLLDPLTVDGGFSPEFVEGEKKNLISAIDARRNDKRTYAAETMMQYMCQGDSFAVSRLGQKEDVAAVTPQGLYDHYRTILQTSRVEIFYVGSAPMERVAELVMPLARALASRAEGSIRQTPFTPAVPPREFSREMEVNQGKLSMGFTTGVTNTHADFAAMQVFNVIFGGGMTSKLFMNVREKLSLCYYASSGYFGSKGIMTVSSGIDTAQYQPAKEEILHQLALCAGGEISQQELDMAKQYMLSSLRSIPDSPGALESYYTTAAISGMPYDLPEYARAVEQVRLADVVRCASGVKLHTVFFLKGVSG